MYNINVFLFFSLISLDLTLVPIWKVDVNAISFFSSGSPNSREIEVFNSKGYILKNIYNKNDDGTITVTHKLTITKNSNTDTKDVNFSNMQLFENVRNFGKVICPQGRFFPLDSNGVPITINIQNSHLDWDLQCVKHNTDVFIALFYNKDHNSLHGYCADREGGKWSTGNDFHNKLYAIKIGNNMLDNNNFYPIIFLTLDGSWIKIIGGKQTLKTDLEVPHTDVVTKNIFEVKSKIYAFFEDNNDKFYVLTYNKDRYSIAYSLKENIGSYATYDNINNLDITKLTDLTLPFADKVEIESMNFINKTSYIYYTVKNLATGKIIME